MGILTTPWILSIMAIHIMEVTTNVSSDLSALLRNGTIQPLSTPRLKNKRTLLNTSQTISALRAEINPMVDFKLNSCQVLCLVKLFF